ncbi:NUDIX domain-containing protein [Microbacterium sp. K27]|uniref:NUDIX domain-containing protein n=1 Tax=Microbacterium sp. K27 TaxID=2305445 RepID=UPI001F0EFFFC|nr:NUDIX domain-containing protein [Microbacterium sp. K27]
MPFSDYVRSIRARIGHDLLLLPGVTAVIREGDRFLLARAAGSEEWGLIGGGVEPGEDPDEAIVREVQEEIGARIRVTGIVGAFGGESLVVTYPNGDRVSYVSTAFACELLDPPVPDQDEVVEGRMVHPRRSRRAAASALGRPDVGRGRLERAIRSGLSEAGPRDLPVPRR